MLYNIFSNFVSGTSKYISFVLIFGLPENHACLVYFVKILSNGLDPEIHLEFIELQIFIFYSLSQFQVPVYIASLHYQILIIYIKRIHQFPTTISIIRHLHLKFLNLLLFQNLRLGETFCFVARLSILALINVFFMYVLLAWN